MKKKILDTNLLIRFLTRDNLQQTIKIRSLFQNAEQSSLYIPDAVILETVFVLLTVYKIEKDKVIEKLNTLIQFDKFDLNASVFQIALDMYSRYTISILDAYLAALSLKEKIPLYTFDKKLLKLTEISAQTP